MKWPFEDLQPPPRFDKWNRAMQGTYIKGARAFLAGESVEDCPYLDKRTDSGRLTWSRAFQITWVDGFVDMRVWHERLQERATRLSR